MSDAFVILGAQRYAVEREWIDASVNLRGISSVAVLECGHVAALFRAAPQVRLFAKDGSTVGQWDVPDLVCPHHIKALPGGGALVTDLDGHRVVALDSNGKQIWALGEKGQPQWMAPFNHPTDAAVDRDGKLYVTDGYGNYCLHRFDTQRSLIQTHGDAGAGPGQFSTPHFVVISEDHEIYVADRENSRVQVFDSQGQFLRQITSMYKPMALALTPKGELLVSDQTASLILFGKTGKVLGRCRVFGVYGHGIAAGLDGTIYISEMIPDCLTRLRPVDR